MSLVDSSQLFGLMRRYLFCSCCTILSLLLLAAIWVLWQDIHSSETVNRERSQEFEAMLSTMVSGPLIRQELTRAQEVVARTESNLVVESKLEDNVGYFYRIQKRTGSEIVYLRQQTPNAGNGSSDYKVIPFSLELGGTFEQVGAFLLELETGPRLVQIRSFNFRRRDQGINSVLLSLEIHLLAKR